MRSTIPCGHWSVYVLRVGIMLTAHRTYRGHDWLAISILHVAKGHLSALMLVDPDLRIVVVLDALQRNYSHGCQSSLEICILGNL